jgi:AGCS family alanine or glycine:cation symporter
VGVGNIGAVAFAITIGGPGALFWIIVGGLLGASLKCAECTLGVKYRTKHQDGSVSGGPMYYLEEGLKEKNLPRLGKIIGCMYAGFIVIGCLGIGNMFQSNQAYEQLQLVTGGADGFLFGKGWLVGGIMAFIVALVLIGGIQSITRVTSKLVPGMAGIYFVAALIVIGLNIDALPGVIADVATQAFNPAGITGGLFAVMIIGFRRSTFSNEAGLGSSSIAHAAVKTNQPASEGLVGLLEPLIDTVIICPLTGLVILLTVFSPEMVGGDVQGVQLTSAAFETVIWWFPNVLAIVIVLFAFSSIIAWGYYGQKGWIYLFGNDPVQSKIFLLIYCVFVLIGCTLDLGVIIDFSDAIVFCMALPNVLGLYFLAPVVKREVGTYLEKLRSVET